MTSCRGGQAMKMGGKKRNLSPGYIMELWATDTHCKAPIWHGKTPQPWLQPPPNPLKEGQEIGLCSKTERWMERWGEEEREVGERMTGQVGGGTHKQELLRSVCSSSTELQNCAMHTPQIREAQHGDGLWLLSTQIERHLWRSRAMGWS